MAILPDDISLLTNSYKEKEDTVIFRVTENI